MRRAERVCREASATSPSTEPASAGRPTSIRWPTPASKSSATRVPDQFEYRLRYAGDAYDFRTWASWLDPADADAVGEYRTGEAAATTVSAER
ncbi:hypothetical protein ACFQGE_11235 [Halomicroarcula sp. GCM10025817]|uniref:hypothetical protein n=1 Tax=Haloarcula TaxID=2237 RepID=UPI0023E83B9D|nr:hypothetical protein [Halomicroarcula sp. SYNS111]